MPYTRCPAEPRKGASVLGMPPNLVLALICVAAFFCCIPMAVPNGASGGVLQRPRHRRPRMARQCCRCCWPARSSAGSSGGCWPTASAGLRAVMAGSACQAVAIGAFLLTQNEVGLFAVSAAFGLGFSGHHPVLRGGDPRAVSVIRGILARAGILLSRHVRHGVRKLARGRAVRPFRVLCAGVRGGRVLQHRQPAGDRLSGGATGRQRSGWLTLIAI